MPSLVAQFLSLGKMGHYDNVIMSDIEKNLQGIRLQHYVKSTFKIPTFVDLTI